MSQVRTQARPGAARYQVATVVLLALITCAFVLLETRNHARLGSAHSRAVWTALRQLTFNPSWLGWQLVYLAGYALYFVPVTIPSFRESHGHVRRTLFGFSVQLLIGSIGPSSWLPCLQIANVSFVSGVVGRAGKPVWRAGLLVAMLLLGINSLLVQQHDVAGPLLGAVLGWVTYRAAFSGQLDFLDSDHPWAAIQFELKELWTLWVSNRRSYWEAAYTAGCWDFLESRAQRPRHYAIAGIIQDRFLWRTDVLDVGCGQAVLYPLLAKSISSYMGIDLADEAIAKCRSAFADDAQCSFQTAAFEAYVSAKRFDAVVLNEILYYFPLGSIEGLFERSLQLLKNNSSVLIVSLCRNYKARLVGRELSRIATPEECIRVHNVLTGSYWTVSVYRRNCPTSAERPASPAPANRSQ